MAITRPYYRITRPFCNDDIMFGHKDFIDLFHGKEFIMDVRYAPDRVSLTHAYKLLENDLMRVFDYVEPADNNLKTFSHQLHQMLLRACTEVEANAKAILVSNDYTNPRSIFDYFKLEPACRLSEYAIIFPVWNGVKSRRKPFESWKKGHSLTWYQAYNDVKHNRFENFPQANLENVLDAVAGVFILLFAQFQAFAFDPYRPVDKYTWDNNRVWHQGSLLQIELPSSWTESEKYDFDWKVLKTEAAPFQKWNFPTA